MLMVSRRVGHQDHNASTCCSQDAQKNTRKIKKTGHKILFVCFGLPWCHCRCWNTINLSVPCRTWDIPSPFILLCQKEVPRNVIIFTRKPKHWESNKNVCLWNSMSHAARVFWEGQRETESFIGWFSQFQRSRKKKKGGRRSGWGVVKLFCWSDQFGKTDRGLFSEARFRHCWRRTRRAECFFSTQNGSTTHE